MVDIGFNTSDLPKTPQRRVVELIRKSPESAVRLLVRIARLHPGMVSELLTKRVARRNDSDDLKPRVGSTVPDTSPTKHARLLELAMKRKSARRPPHRGIGEYHNGYYECDHVSPYTKSAGNVNADVFVMLQDWSSDSWLKTHRDAEVRRLGLARSLPTNKWLERLLCKHLGKSLADVYATNLFPLVKMGNLDRDIPQRDLVWAAQEFAIPQVKIVAPKLVICLGVQTFNAMRRACGERLVQNIDEGLEKSFKLGGAQIWCQSHPGGRGRATRNAGDFDRVAEDWKKMREAYDKLA